MKHSKANGSRVNSKFFTVTRWPLADGCFIAPKVAPGRACQRLALEGDSLQSEVAPFEVATTP